MLGKIVVSELGMSKCYLEFFVVNFGKVKLVVSLQIGIVLIILCVVLEQMVCLVSL